MGREREREREREAALKGHWPPLDSAAGPFEETYLLVFSRAAPPESREDERASPLDGSARERETSSRASAARKYFLPPRRRRRLSRFVKKGREFFEKRL